VRLTFADGLIMNGGAAGWQPVPDEIVLTSSEPMHLHVRQVGDSRVLSMRVLGHPVDARVSMGPKALHWPGDDVHIEVDIRGTDTPAPPSWIEPRFRVLLGIDELDVAWRHVDGKFLADVPPQAGDGPWIVRVEVDDQYGHPLGRDFLEIASRERAAARP
jgi:hypothetical protein